MRHMIVHHTNKKSALYCKGGSNNPHCKHRYHIIIITIDIIVVIMLVLFLVLVRTNVVCSLHFCLIFSCTLPFVFIIEQEHKRPDNRLRLCVWA